MTREEEEAYFADEAGKAQRAEAAELERQAVTIINQYGFFLPAPVKAFLRKLATHLQWNDLERKLK